LSIEKIEYYGNVLTKLKTDLYDYSLILPNRYKIIYIGIDSDLDFIESFNDDLKLEYIKDRIIIVNFDSHPLNIHEVKQIEEDPKDPDKYYRIIRDCEYILIKFNDNKKISDIDIYFRYISPESFKYNIGCFKYEESVSLLEIDNNTKQIKQFIYDNHVLTGIKTPLFPYEILLPGEYVMIYGGYEDQGNIYRSCSIDNSIINSERFNGLITIINLNPKSIPIVCTDVDYIDGDEDALSLYKHICIFGFITYIKFDEENKYITNIITEYIMNANGDNCHSEFIYVNRSDDLKENRLARIEY